MFDISPINTPISTFATAKNAPHYFYVEYYDNGNDRSNTFDTYEKAEAWAKSKGLKEIKDYNKLPSKNKEYRIVGE